MLTTTFISIIAGITIVNTVMTTTNTLTESNMETFDQYQLDELKPSWCSQLDVVGMQPHSREYLEHESNCMRSQRKLYMVDGQTIDYTDGIQFSGSP
jgi:hypothetical protein